VSCSSTVSTEDRRGVFVEHCSLQVHVSGALKIMSGQRAQQHIPVETLASDRGFTCTGTFCCSSWPANTFQELKQALVSSFAFHRA
jgi:hypothetical protein